MLKYRDYRAIFPLTLAEMRKLLACVDETPDGCWLWTGPITTKGYGRVYLRGHWWLAHRMMHEWLVGPTPSDRVTHHRCRNNRCSNPEHLRSATQSDNVADGYAARGSDRPRRLRSCCKNGHRFTEETTIWRLANGKPHRLCRLCRDATARRRNETRKSQRAAALRSSIDPAPEASLDGGKSSSLHPSHFSHVPPSAASAAGGMTVGDEPRKVPYPSSQSADFHPDPCHFAPVGAQPTEPLHRRPSLSEGDV